MHKYLKTALKNAFAHDYDSHLEYQLCAVIARGGAVLSFGFNKPQTNGFVEHYTDQIIGADRDYSMNTHAEMDAISVVRSKVDLRGSKIYVARIRPPGNLDGNTIGLARPCEICQNILFNYGIRRAYYTIDDNNFGVMKIVHRDDPTHSIDKEVYVGGDKTDGD